MWRLVGIQGVYGGRFFDLTADSVTIGRGDCCGVALADDQSVAENQSELVICNGSYVFRDIDKACPTTVNGAVPEGMVTLNHGDTIQIGESVFRFEQVEAAACSTACTFAKMETGNGVQAPAKAMLWKPKAALLLAALLVLAVAVPNIRRVNEDRARRAEGVKMAQEAVASLQSLGSALKVGVSHDEYSKNLIDAQTKIDAYIGKFGKGEFGGFGGKLLSVQQAYADADDLWDYKIQYDQGDFFSEYGVYDRETEERATELYRMCRSRYPQTFKPIRHGGAKMDSVFMPLHTNTAMQLIWEQASEEMSGLKLPGSDQ